MSYHLFLDDVRMPKDVTWMKIPTGVDWKIVRDFWEFKRYVMEHGVPAFVTFDHDLADSHYRVMLNDRDPNKEVDYGPEKTGLHCAQFLVDYCHHHNASFPQYSIHSLNPVGSERIEAYVKQAIECLEL